MRAYLCQLMEGLDLRTIYRHVYPIRGGRGGLIGRFQDTLQKVTFWNGESKHRSEGLHHDLVFPVRSWQPCRRATRGSKLAIAGIVRPNSTKSVDAIAYQHTTSVCN